MAAYEFSVALTRFILVRYFGPRPRMTTLCGLRLAIVSGPSLPTSSHMSFVTSYLITTDCDRHPTNGFMSRYAN